MEQFEELLNEVEDQIEKALINFFMVGYNKSCEASCIFLIWHHLGRHSHWQRSVTLITIGQEERAHGLGAYNFES